MRPMELCIENGRGVISSSVTWSISEIFQARLFPLGCRESAHLRLLSNEMLFLLVAMHPQMPALFCTLDGFLHAQLQTCNFRKGRECLDLLFMNGDIVVSEY